MRFTRWDEETYGALSVEAARARFHRALYEVLVRQVGEPTRLAGKASQRTLIGLKGSWVLEAGGRRAIVNPGDIVELAPGDFVFLAPGPVVYLAVYPLPPERVLN